MKRTTLLALLSLAACGPLAVEEVVPCDAGTFPANTICSDADVEWGTSLCFAGQRLVCRSHKEPEWQRSYRVWTVDGACL